MDAVEFIKTKARMTGSCGIDCRKCPIYDANNGTGLDCLEFMQKYPEKTVEIVEKWAAEHPVKTRRSEFLKLFPNADIKSIQPCYLDMDKECCKKLCYDCREEYWNEEVE